MLEFLAALLLAFSLAATGDPEVPPGGDAAVDPPIIIQGAAVDPPIIVSGGG